MMTPTTFHVPAGSNNSESKPLPKESSVSDLDGVITGSPVRFSLSESGIALGKAKVVKVTSGSDDEMSDDSASGNHSPGKDMPADPAPLLALLLPGIVPPEPETCPAALTQATLLSTQSDTFQTGGLTNLSALPASQQGALLPAGTLPAEFESTFSPEKLFSGMQLPSMRAGNEIIQSNTGGNESLPITTVSQPQSTGTEIVQGLAFASANDLLQHDSKIPPSPPLSVPADEQTAAETLSKALGDRLQMQLDRGIQRATIRLDPPSLGKLDISLHYQEGKLQVHIQAMQPDVLRALQQTAPELRAVLSTNNQVQVNVQLSQQGSERQAHPSHQSQESENVTGQPDSEAEEKTIRSKDNSVITRV